MYTLNSMFSEICIFGAVVVLYSVIKFHQRWVHIAYFILWTSVPSAILSQFLFCRFWKIWAWKCILHFLSCLQERNLSFAWQWWTVKHYNSGTSEYKLGGFGGLHRFWSGVLIYHEGHSNYSHQEQNLEKQYYWS